MASTELRAAAQQTQPEALRLADALEPCCLTIGDAQQAVAAAELRRLHAENEAFGIHLSERMKDLARVEAERDALLEALKLALSSHGVMLMSDPPQDAWKVNRVEERARAAIKQAEGEKP